MAKIHFPSVARAPLYSRLRLGRLLLRPIYGCLAHVLTCVRHSHRVAATSCDKPLHDLPCLKGEVLGPRVGALPHMPHEAIEVPAAERARGDHCCGPERDPTASEEEVLELDLFVYDPIQ